MTATFADQAAVVAEACALVDQGDLAAARHLVATEYPLDSASPPLAFTGTRKPARPGAGDRRPRRTSSERVRSRLFARDGYVDRYTGRRLVSPPVLRLLGEDVPGLLAEVLPYDVNGGRGEPAKSGRRRTCHQAGFELYASLEHVVPFSSGGDDGADPELRNFVTTTPDLNNQKNGTGEVWLPQNPPGDLTEWDGLTGWFVRCAEQAELRSIPWVRRWRSALHAVADDALVATVQRDRAGWHESQADALRADCPDAP